MGEWFHSSSILLRPLSIINNQLIQLIMKITAIKSKNQSLVNKSVNWLVKYNTFNNERDVISDNLDEYCEDEDSKEWRKVNKKCEDSFDKYQECCEDLPKYEVNNIEKSELY